MIEGPELLKYPQYYKENELYKNKLGHLEKRYITDKSPPEFVKLTYRKNLKYIRYKKISLSYK